MYESPEYYENQINELVVRLNLEEKKLADVRRKMTEVQEKLDSAFILAFGKKKALRDELNALSNRERLMSAKIRALEDELAITHAKHERVLEARRTAEAAEQARLAAEKAAQNNAFEIRDGVLIKYSGTAKDVVIPDDVYKIGESAFESCNISSVVIPDHVTTISKGAFLYCNALESVTIPEGVIEIGERAFCCCGIKQLTLPNSLIKIGAEAFYCCKLESITLPDGVTEIGHGAFLSCKLLVTAVLPRSIRRLSYSIFTGCSALKSIVIPDGVEDIQFCSFQLCSNLERVVIPASVTSIGSDAFWDCEKLVATIQQGSVAEKYCRQNKIKYVYMDGSVPTVPKASAAEEAPKHEATTQPVTEKKKASPASAVSKTPVAVKAPALSSQHTAEKKINVASSRASSFDLSEVPENIRPKLEKLLLNLLGAYPDKVVSHLYRDHGKWAEKLSELYKELGYPSSQVLLEHYGFTVEKDHGGRPTKDHTAVIEELRQLYPHPFEGSVLALGDAHPELKSRLKTLTNNAQALFGMSLSDYLKQEGIITGRLKKEPKPAPVVEPVAEKTPQEKLDDAMNKLKERYPDLSSLPKTVAQMKTDNPDISFDSMSGWVKAVSGMTLKEYLTANDLIRKAAASKQNPNAAAGDQVPWEDVFSQTILSRGLDYYYGSKVDLDPSMDNENYSAIVSGSEEYDVFVCIRDNVLKSMSCTCPYAGDGLRCKHMAAVLYAVTKGRKVVWVKEAEAPNPAYPPVTPKSVPVYEHDPEPKQQLRTVPASPYAYNTCGINEVLAVSCSRNALQDLADNCIYQNSGVIEYSKNPACYFMTITLEDENPFEEIMEEVAEALAGCGVAVKRHDEDDNDLRDIFFFDGTSLWSGNEDDLCLLHAGRLNGDAVDANDWFISYYGPDEDGADEHWDELEKNWNNVKKDLAYFRLSDYVRLCLNMEI